MKWQPLPLFGINSWLLCRYVVLWAVCPVVKIITFSYSPPLLEITFKCKRPFSGGVSVLFLLWVRAGLAKIERLVWNSSGREVSYVSCGMVSLFTPESSWCSCRSAGSILPYWKWIEEGSGLGSSSSWEMVRRHTSGHLLQSYKAKWGLVYVLQASWLCSSWVCQVHSVWCEWGCRWPQGFPLWLAEVDTLLSEEELVAM